MAGSRGHEPRKKDGGIEAPLHDPKGVEESKSANLCTIEQTCGPRSPKMGLLGRSLKRRQKRRNYAVPANTTAADRGWITEPAECSAEPRSIASKYPAPSAKAESVDITEKKDETN
jgi:hypothetical protein